MSNPNNCATCDHKRHPDCGWCYMFRDEPQALCAKHTQRQLLQTCEYPHCTCWLVGAHSQGNCGKGPPPVPREPHNVMFSGAPAERDE